MKILHILPWYEPAWATGGTAVATSMLCRALAQKNIDITVYTTDDDGKGGNLNVPLNKEINLGGVKVYYFHCDFWLKKKKSFNSMGLIRKLKETGHNYDLIHLSSSRFWFEREVFKLSKKIGIPYILSPHASLMNFFIKEIGNNILKFIYIQLISKPVIKESRAIHFLSEGERQESSKYRSNKENFIIPNGINIEEFKRFSERKKRLREKFNLPEDSIVLLFTGRIHPLKNIDIVIISLGMLKEIATNNFYFLIVGPAQDKIYFKKLNDMINSRGLQNIIKFFPPVTREIIKEFYWVSDIFLLPSKVEGMSMSIIEASASSLPIIISNRAANYHEIQEDEAGIVISPTIDAITYALKKVFDSNEYRKKLSSNALKSAKNRYDINKVAALMIKAYENVLTGRRSPELRWM